MSFQEEIMNLMEKADALILQGKIAEGITEYQNALVIAKQNNWEQKKLDIENIIEEVYRKEQERLEKAQETEKLVQLKRMKEEKEKTLEIAANRYKSKMEEERRKKLQELSQKKKRDEELFYRGVEILEEGNNLISEKKFELGLQKLEEAFKVFQSINSEAEIIRVKEFIEDAKLKKSEYENQMAKKREEEQKLKQSLKEEESSKLMKQRIEEQKAMETIKKEEFKKEKEGTREALTQQAFSFMDQGMIQANGKKFDEAIELYRKALEIFKNMGNDNEAQKVLAQIAIFKEEKKDYEAKQQKERDTSQKRLIQKAFELMDEGLVRSQEKNYEAAIEFYKQALEIFKSLGEENEVQKVLTQISVFRDLIKENEIKLQKEKELREKRKKEEEELQKELETQNRALERKKSEEQLKKKEEVDLKKKQDDTYRTALKIIEGAENRGKEYEDKVRQGKILELECPYESILAEYRTARNMLLDVGLQFEANSISEGIALYSDKIKKDSELRNLEQEKIKKKQEEKADYENLIKLSKKKEAIEELEKSEAEREEFEKKRQKDKRLQDALSILEKADALTKEKKYDEALKIFQSSLSVFEELEWEQGKNLVKDSIENTLRLKEQDLAIKKKQQEKKEEEEAFYKSIEEKKKEMIKLKEEELTLKQSAELKRKKTQEYENKVLELIITASEQSDKKEYDQALKSLNEALSYCDLIEWQLKKEQIKELISGVEFQQQEDKRRLQIESEELQKTREQQTLFEQQIEKMRQERLQKEKEERELKKKQMSKKELETMLSNQAYEFIAHGEKKVNSKEHYAALLNFKKASLNFNEIGWTYESSVAINRAKQITSGISNCLLQIDEFFGLNDLGLLTELTNYLDVSQKNTIQKEYDLAIMDLEKSAKICQQTKMKESFNTIQKMIETLKIEKQKYEEQLNKPKEGSEEEIAFGLLEKSSVFEKGGRLSEAIRFAQEALAIFKRLKFAREIENTEIKIRALEREKIRKEQTISMLQESLKAKEEAEMSEEERLQKLLEQRREERLKKRSAN